jgi:hypothetical protein
MAEGRWRVERDFCWVWWRGRGGCEEHSRAKEEGSIVNNLSVEYKMIKERGGGGEEAGGYDHRVSTTRRKREMMEEGRVRPP